MTTVLAPTLRRRHCQVDDESSYQRCSATSTSSHRSSTTHNSHSNNNTHDEFASLFNNVSALVVAVLDKLDDTKNYASTTAIEKVQQWNVPDLNALWVAMVSSGKEILSSFVRFVESSPWKATLLRTSTKLSPSTIDVLHQFWKHVNIGYDRECVEHQQILERFWDLGAHAWAGKELPQFAFTGKQWKSFGFQGVDPATDFRGAGLFGVECLVYFGENYPHSFARMLNGPKDYEHYPFAIAALNVVFMLLSIINLVPVVKQTGSPRWHSEPGQSLVCFSRLLSSPHSPAGVRERFLDLFCVSFLLLDCFWNERHATYMQFPLVLADTRTAVVSLLARAPASFSEFQATVQGEYSLDLLDLAL